MEAEFIHSQRQKWTRKNPDQTTVARNEAKLKLHEQPTTLAPSQHIPHQPLPSPPPYIFSWSHSRINAFALPPRHNIQTPTIWKKPSSKQAPQGIKSKKVTSQLTKRMKYH